MPATRAAEIVTSHAAFHLPLSEYGPSRSRLFRWDVAVENPATGAVLGVAGDQAAAASDKPPKQPV
jgi:hypothetical protein